MKLDWMKEVDWKQDLTEDLRMVLDVCGEEAVLALLERLSGHRLYVSAAPIKAAQRRYIQKFAGRKSPQILAAVTGAPEGLVRRVLLEQENDDQD